MYRTNVSSLLSVKICCTLRFLALGRQLFIRMWMVDSETSYICIACWTDNFFVVQIVSIARTILAFLVCVCIILLWNCCVQKIERCIVGENAQVAYMRRSLMNHVI